MTISALKHTSFVLLTLRCIVGLTVIGDFKAFIDVNPIPLMAQFCSPLFSITAFVVYWFVLY